MADWYVDATSGDDGTGDGLSWATAWQTMQHAFTTIPTPSPSENQIVNIKGSHTIPAGGWSTTAANQSWVWGWVLQGHDGAELIRSDRFYFASERKVAFHDLTLGFNYAAASYTSPLRVTEGIFRRCTFNPATGAGGYNGGSGQNTYIDCTIQGPMYSSDSCYFACDFKSGGTFYGAEKQSFVLCRFRSGSAQNWGTGTMTFEFRQCSFDGFSFSTQEPTFLIVDECVLSNVSGMTSQTGLFLTNSVIHSTSYTALQESGNTTASASPFSDSEFTPTAEVTGHSVPTPGVIAGAIQDTGGGGGGGGSTTHNPFRSRAFAGGR